MRIVSRMLGPPFRRDLVAGGGAGLAGGLLFWWALQAQGMALTVPGLLGFTPSGLGVMPHLVGSILLGAGFGALLRHQPRGQALMASAGLLYGLLWWIVGPIALGPLWDGRGPTWSLVEASPAFPSLIGHLLYGGVTGLGFYLLVAAYLRLRPEEGPAPAPVKAPTRRVVILGGGFGGMSTARRLERIFARDPGLEITLVSRSNYLLFTPMLAEVASSGLEPQHISAPVRASCPQPDFTEARWSRSIWTKERSASSSPCSDAKPQWSWTSCR